MAPLKNREVVTLRYFFGRSTDTNEFAGHIFNSDFYLGTDTKLIDECLAFWKSWHWLWMLVPVRSFSSLFDQFNQIFNRLGKRCTLLLLKFIYLVEHGTKGKQQMTNNRLRKHNIKGSVSQSTPPHPLQFSQQLIIVRNSASKVDSVSMHYLTCNPFNGRSQYFTIT